MKIILTAVLILLVSVCSAHADKIRITVPIDYENKVDYFSLYVDGDRVCDTETGDIPQISCMVDIDFGMRVFNISATRSGFESEISKPYTVMVKPELKRPVIFKVLFGEGESLVIKPIEIVPKIPLP